MNNKNNNGFLRNAFLYIIVIIAVVTGVQYFAGGSQSSSQQLSYTQLVKKIEDGKVKSITYQPDGSIIEVKGSYKKAEKVDTDLSLPFLGSASSETRSFTSTVLQNETTMQKLQSASEAADVNVKMIRESSSGAWISYLFSYLPLIGIAIFFLFMMNQGGNRGAMNFGRNRAKTQSKENIKVRFTDVAGAEEEKEELVEVVDFLKNPRKYKALGARIPKGVLLEGPPGTGKTLLAKAVAGEADVPFFSISGSDFVEMFVGVGASRVRDLFKEAQKQAPCIIFIDEIDAIGKSRDARYGGNDEREQTLNQLLSEMDGFDASKGLLILAATNRPEVLDKALLRPGRFDRRIIVDKPDLKGREAILQVHAKDVLMDETVDLNAIALATSGAVGSDLANMINEAAINAVKHGRKYVSQADLFESVEVVIAGKEKKDRIMGPKEKKIVAYHEVGHALVTALQKNTEPVQKITIVPRTHGALGYVMQVPEEEKFLKSKEELEEDLVTFMAGRAAEEIVFHSVTTGASNDIEQATRIARAMVAQYGMSERFGLMGLATVESQYLDGEARLNCGEETAAEIDKEVMKMLKESYEKAKQLLSENREVLDKIAAHLYEKENITGKEFMKIYRELKGIPEPEEENVAKQGASVDFRVGEEATHTVDLNKATSEKEESEEEDPNKENSREEDFEQETDV